MFAVIYQGYVKPGREAEYEELWHAIADYFKRYRGALGSCLHRAEDGRYIAYSRWPDKATRDVSWSEDVMLPENMQQVVKAFKDCLDEERKIPELCMEVKDDLLIP